MTPAVRTYRSEQRQALARHTRQRVLARAAAAFVAYGYAGTTIRGIAEAAAVSVPTVELLFGTKKALLKEAIDVAIAGDDEPLPVLQREWASRAQRAPDVSTFLSVAAEAIGSAQQRSAGLVLAAFEGAAVEPDLAALTRQLIDQRLRTAAWMVDAVMHKARLHPGQTREEAIDTVWVLMDPAVFLRLTRDRHQSLQAYAQWWARSMRWLLVDCSIPPEGQQLVNPAAEKGRLG